MEIEPIPVRKFKEEGALPNLDSVKIRLPESATAAHPSIIEQMPEIEVIFNGQPLNINVTGKSTFFCGCYFLRCGNTNFKRKR